MIKAMTFFSGFLTLAIMLLAPSAYAQKVDVFSYKIVKIYPHDPQAFTQGLFFKDGALYESTGRRGTSFIRKVDLETGKSLQQVDLEPDIFGEGSVDLGDEIISLTWKQQKGYIWKAETFEQTGSFDYEGEGWGLTRNDDHLIMSDGSATLRFLSMDDMSVMKTLDVSINGTPLARLNELEWYQGEIYANVWMTNYIVAINPVNGKVTKLLDMTGVDQAGGFQAVGDYVLNGIAVNEEGRLFVTGKKWPKLFEIEMVKR